MRWIRPTLQRKVLLTLLAVGLVPAAAGVGLTASELWRVIREVSGDNLLTEARNVAGLLDREINNFINAASDALAAEPTAVQLFANPDAAAAATSLTLIASSLWGDMSSSRTVLVIPVKGPLRSFLLPAQDTRFQATNRLLYRSLEVQFLEARRLSILPGLKAVTVHTDPVVRRPVALAWVPVSPRNTDLFCGWICVEIPVDELLHGDVSRALFDVDEACVITNVGHVLGGLRFRPARTMLLHDRLSLYEPTGADWFSVRFPDGENQLVGFSPLPLTRALRKYGRSDSDWYICIGRDLRPRTAAFRLQIARDLLGGAFLAALLSIVAWLFARRLTQPIQRLEAGVQRVADGDLTSRVEVHTGDELERLAGEFNTMADRLEQTALDVQRQMATVRRQANELALLYETSHAINAQLDLDQTFATFARETRRLISYDRLSVALLDEDGEHYTVQFVFPEAEASEFSPGTRHRLSESYINEAVRQGRPFVRRALDQPPLRPVDEFLASAGLTTALFVPLISGQVAIGSVNLASHDPAAFVPDEQERMARLTESVAVAIQHRRLFMRVRRFAEELEAEVKRRTAQLRLAQDKLVQTEKLAASGQLAAGIAHEINNPLGIINNYLRLAASRLRTAHDPAALAAIPHLQIIEEEISRIARIVRNLLDLYHPREESPVPTDLHGLLERVLELFAPNWAKRNIRVVRHLSPHLPSLVVSSDRLRQVFINLFRNAEDAMETGGTLTLSTRLEPAAAEWEEERVVVEVDDNGCGIPRTALARVFDPFFTTKQGGVGTGLGLSVSFGIVRSYGGTIDLDSEEGRGTRVTLSLPVNLAAVSPPPVEVEAKAGE